MTTLCLRIHREIDPIINDNHYFYFDINTAIERLNERETKLRAIENPSLELKLLHEIFKGRQCIEILNELSELEPRKTINFPLTKLNEVFEKRKQLAEVFHLYRRKLQPNVVFQETDNLDEHKTDCKVCFKYYCTEWRKIDNRIFKSDLDERLEQVKKRLAKPKPEFDKSCFVYIISSTRPLSVVKTFNKKTEDIQIYDSEEEQ